MYPILTRKKAKRQFRLNKAAATEIVQRAVINRSLYFLKLFKETLDKFYDGNNWALKITHTSTCKPVGWGPVEIEENPCTCTPLKEYTWLGDDPHDLVNEVFVKWEERNGPIQAVEAGHNIGAQL